LETPVYEGGRWCRSCGGSPVVICHHNHTDAIELCP
jgi:hypothetical protein